MAGSDVPWGGTIGNTRVYAYTGRPFSPEGWLEAVRQGRTFVTTGPMLQFTANGQTPGSLLSVSSWGEDSGVGQSLGLGATPAGDARNHRFRRNAAQGYEAGRPGVFDDRLEFPASRSAWVTALARTASDELTGHPGFFQGAIATPVYIQVDGGAWIEPRSVSRLVQERLNDLAAIEDWLGENRTASMREAIDQARRYYRMIGE